MLPKVTLPTTKCDLPILGKTVRIRAITLKEEKTLLLAKEAGNTEDIEDSIIQMISNCIDDDSIRVDQLAMPDLVIAFIAIIGISKGSITNAALLCNNILEDGSKCGTKFTVPIDLNDVKIEGVTQNTLVDVDESIKMKLVYPSIATIRKAKKHSTDEIEYNMRLYAYSIDSVYQEDEVFTDFSDDEIYEWVLALPEDALNRFKDFFSQMPDAVLKVKIKCPKCHVEEELDYRGVESFFEVGTLG